MSRLEGARSLVTHDARRELLLRLFEARSCLSVDAVHLKERIDRNIDALYRALLRTSAPHPC